MSEGRGASGGEGRAASHSVIQSKARGPPTLPLCLAKERKSMRKNKELRYRLVRCFSLFSFYLFFVYVPWEFLPAVKE